MITEITNGVRISVFPHYEESMSEIDKHHFFHSYTVHIENQRDEPVQLLRRHWFILDSMSHPQEVEGEGVVGEQPIIEAGKMHEYTSACPLQSTIGMMRGSYLMRAIRTGQTFEAKIPGFLLICPAILN